jgi:hypothetical protein
VSSKGGFHAWNFSQIEIVGDIALSDLSSDPRNSWIFLASSGFGRAETQIHMTYSLEVSGEFELGTNKGSDP